MRRIFRLFTVLSVHLAVTCILIAYVTGKQGVSQGVSQGIVGIPRTSYLLSVDDKGFLLTSLKGTNDPLWQFKTGPNRHDGWQPFFDNSNTVPILPGGMFRNGGHLWTLGLRHSLLIMFGTALFIFTHRVRVCRFLNQTAICIRNWLRSATESHGTDGPTYPPACRTHPRRSNRLPDVRLYSDSPKTTPAQERPPSQTLPDGCVRRCDHSDRPIHQFRLAEP